MFCNRGLKISAPRIGDDPECYGADTSIDGAKVVLDPCTMIVDGDDKVQSFFGIAEDVLHQSFVRIGGQLGDQGLDRVDDHVCLDGDNERLDRKGCVLDGRQGDVFRFGAVGAALHVLFFRKCR